MDSEHAPLDDDDSDSLNVKDEPWPEPSRRVVCAQRASELWGRVRQGERGPLIVLVSVCLVFAIVIVWVLVSVGST